MVGGEAPSRGEGSDPAPATTRPPPSREIPVGSILVDPTRASRTIDPRVFGTNLPAWAGPELLADPAFHRATIDSGTTLIRMPGGSWSNLYDWLACELAEEACFWTWAARPTDFIGFLEATDLPGMWTISINETAEKAAAAVSFFNGSVDDATPIGVDRNGVDWQTVGHWARLRADGGHAEPVGIELWEVGNEVFGGRPDTGGDQCAGFGWEEVWTCDGTEYAEGTDEHDGALAIRSAMLAVDPSIEVGLVGTAMPANWSNFGNEVIESAGSALDFYIVHFYGFDRSEPGPVVVQRAQELWPTVISNARSGLPDDVPIAVTEYNLVSNEANDSDRSMTQVMNALFLADTLDQLVGLGVPIANQWNLANGTTSSGTDYGLISVENGTRFPAFDALRAWSRSGDTLLESFGEIDDQLRISATLHDNGRITMVVLGLSDGSQEATIVVSNAEDGSAAFEFVSAADVTSSSWTSAAENVVEIADETLVLQVPPWSIGVLEIDAPTTTS